MAHPIYATICSDSNPTCSLGQLIKIIREAHMEVVVDKLIIFFSSKEDELRDISGLGVWHSSFLYLVAKVVLHFS